MSSKGKAAAPAAAKPAAKKEEKKTVEKKGPVLSVPFTAAARPQVAVRKLTADGVVDNVSLPTVFIAPIRLDVVHFVHSSMAKNHRQPYAVFAGAGHQHSAESWGTGRAVARIPRVSGGGTSRAGQAAFGNMCRKGHMFAPTKTWRRWHRKINTNQKRFAVASALAATALPSLVLARGHRIEQVPEIPLVLDNAVESINKTKDAIKALKQLGAFSDIEKSAESKKLRAGKGKMRNRRYTSRRGPLVVYKEDNGITQAFRNLPGVEVCHVDRLNLLQLAPGGHLGRFVVWSKNAFQALNANWGNYKSGSQTKSGYKLPRPQMANSDLTRIINSDEVQSAVRPVIQHNRKFHLKKNPLKNLGARVKLNPYALVQRRAVLLNNNPTIKEARRKALGLKKNAKAIQDNIAKVAANVAKKQTAAKKAAKKIHNKNTKFVIA